jgi:hypothetical protein
MEHEPTKHEKERGKGNREQCTNEGNTEPYLCKISSMDSKSRYLGATDSAVKWGGEVKSYECKDC